MIKKKKEWRNQNENSILQTIEEEIKGGYIYIPISFFTYIDQLSIQMKMKDLKVEDLNDNLLTLCIPQITNYNNAHDGSSNGSAVIGNCSASGSAVIGTGSANGAAVIGNGSATCSDDDNQRIKKKVLFKNLIFSLCEYKYNFLLTIRNKILLLLNKGKRKNNYYF